MKLELKKLNAGFTAGLPMASAANVQVVSIATGEQGSLAFNPGQAVAKVANENARIAVGK